MSTQAAQGPLTLHRAGLVLLFAIIAVVHWRLAPYAFDDAYIHFRIARHLAAHGEPYFNLGEPVMASSSSLWTLVLTPLFAMGAGVHGVVLLNAVCTTLCVPVYGALIANAAGQPRSVRHDVAAGLIVVPLLAASSTGLMETPLAVLLAGIGMRAFAARRTHAFAFLAAAACTRVELSVLALAFAAAGLVSAPRMRLRAVVGWAALVALPIIAYDLAFFGTLIPHAVHAKAAAYQLTWADSLGRLAPSLERLPLRHELAALMCAALGVAMIAVLGRPLPATARLSFACGLAVLLAYAASRGFVFEWYVPLYAVLLAWPVASVALREADEGKAGNAMRAAAALATVGLLLGTWLVLPEFVMGTFIPADGPLFTQGARARQYIAVGRQLFDRYPGASLLSSEVGGLGEGFPGPILDGLGLVSPAAVRFHPMRVPEERRSGSVGAIPPGFVAQENPGLLVSYDIFDDAFRASPVAMNYRCVVRPLFLEQDARLAAQAGVPRALWGIRELHVCVRKDLAAERGLPFSDTPFERSGRS